MAAKKAAPKRRAVKIQHGKRKPGIARRRAPPKRKAAAPRRNAETPATA